MAHNYLHRPKGNLGLYTGQSDHNYCKVSPRSSEQVGQHAVTNREGFRQVEIKNGGTRDIDYFHFRVSHQVTTHVSWRLDPYRKGRDAFQMCWTHKKGYAFPHFPQHAESYKKV